ncbi:unnamed protein product [Porites evermanni]|uniref:Transferrin receptor-like dimerisation domain-containing protein n=1 Tax=Porites evermanni TaxID=104178 RepID=A0ABN8Q7N9_9CNID|nr:unnamed protein product [Porites evermanni]
MGMSVQKKFLCGFASFVLFIGLVGFFIGFFARPSSNSESCSGGKNGNEETSGMLGYEKELLSQVLEQRIRYYLDYFKNLSIATGTNSSCSQAQHIKNEWNSLGLNTVEIKRYDVLRMYPKRPSEVSLVDTTGSIKYSSALIQKNKASIYGVAANTLPFSAYSTSGIATGKLIYVNYGREKDFKHLQALNISCVGKIVLLRYGKVLEDTKVANALKWNVSGVLLYLDPAEYTSNTTDVNAVKWYPSETVRSGGLWAIPGYPATAGILRESVEDVLRFQIPVQPISCQEAEKLLRLLNQTAVPKPWQGGMNFSYGIQMDSSDKRNVSMNVSLAVFKQAVCNVVGTIKGLTEPDRYVTLGASSLSVGAALLMEVVRVLMSIKKKGWMPRRTIKICHWGSGYIGSLEWTEEYHKLLQFRSVAYLNVDSCVQGKVARPMIRSSPLLEETTFEVAKMVRLSEGQRTLYDEIKKTKFDKSFLSQAGGDSGCFTFTNIGVPCTCLTGYHPYNVSTNYYAALAKLWLQMTFNIAGSMFIPYDVVRYADTLCAFVKNLSTTYNGTLRVNNITLEVLLKAAEVFQAAAKTYQKCLHTVDKTNVLQVRVANDHLLQLEKAFISKGMFPGMPFVGHVILAPSYFTAATDNTFPGIIDSIRVAQESGIKNDWEKVQQQISVVAHAFRTAVSFLQPPDI